jgi:ABC-2 type transport system ATP-binding protein
MQRRLSLAAALVHDPELMLLDEPTAGVDPILRRRFWDRFRELRDGGRTLIVSTQYVGEAAECDLVAVMVDGRVVHVAPPDQLASDAGVVATADEPLDYDEVFLRLVRAARREEAAVR